MNHSDMGDYPRAFAALESAIERAERAGDRRRLAFALSLLARAQLLREETDDAGRSLDRALTIVDAERGWRSSRSRRRCGARSTCAIGDVERASVRFGAPTSRACEPAIPAGKAWPRATSACCTARAGGGEAHARSAISRGARPQQVPARS